MGCDGRTLLLRMVECLDENGRMDERSNDAPRTWRPDGD